MKYDLILTAFEFGGRNLKREDGMAGAPDGLERLESLNGLAGSGLNYRGISSVIHTSDLQRDAKLFLP